MKVVINRCFGGFGLSHEAMMLYAKLKGFKLYPFAEKRDANNHVVAWDEFVLWDGTGEPPLLLYYSKSPLVAGKYIEKDYFSYRDIERTDPTLVRVIEELGSKANGRFALLKVVDVPDDADYTIPEYDGIEHIAEKHRVWS